MAKMINTKYGYVTQQEAEMDARLDEWIELKRRLNRMEVSHTLDGYWVLSGYIDPEHENAQAIMAKAKNQFIEANPLIDSAKVIVVNGEFNQPINKTEIDKSLA